MLFIGFYVSTYKKPVRKGRGRATSALVEMKDEQVPDAKEVRRRLSGGAQSFASAKENVKDMAKDNGYMNGSANGSATPGTGRVTRSRKA